MTDQSQLVALLAFILALYGSPGPATMSLAASGAAFGFRRSLPYGIGILIGLVLNHLLVAVGLGYLFEQYPLAHTVFKYVSMVYILYLAYRIVQSSVVRTKDIEPLGFGQGIVLNLINPKAYIVALAVFSQFAVPGPMYYQHITQIMIIIMIIAVVLDLGWIYIGALLQKPFSSGLAARRLNVTLAVLLVGSVFIATFI